MTDPSTRREQGPAPCREEGKQVEPGVGCSSASLADKRPGHTTTRPISTYSHTHAPAQVTGTDIRASNGVVHTVASVGIPPSPPAPASAIGESPPQAANRYPWEPHQCCSGQAWHIPFVFESWTLRFTIY